MCACMCVSVCHNACYGPQSSIGWPQLSWSHWRRFHRSVQRYSAILPGPKGASTSTHTLLHTHTLRHTKTCTFTHTNLKIPQIHTFTQRSTQHSYETIHTDTYTLRQFSLRCTVLIDSTWQSFSGGKNVRSRENEKNIGVEVRKSDSLYKS